MLFVIYQGIILYVIARSMTHHTLKTFMGMPYLSNQMNHNRVNKQLSFSYYFHVRLFILSLW